VSKGVVDWMLIQIVISWINLIFVGASTLNEVF